MHIKLGSPGIGTKHICNCNWCTKVNTKVHNATKEENTIISFCKEASDFLSTFSHTVLVSAKGVGQYMVVPSGGRLAQLSLKAYCFVCIVVWYKHWGISSTMTTKRAWWGLKSPVSRLFSQSFIQARIKEIIKAPRHWPLCGEFTGHRWIARKEGPVTRKMFLFDDVTLEPYGPRILINIGSGNGLLPIDTKPWYKPIPTHC